MEILQLGPSSLFPTPPPPLFGQAWSVRGGVHWQGGHGGRTGRAVGVPLPTTHTHHTHYTKRLFHAQNRSARRKTEKNSPEQMLQSTGDEQQLAVHKQSRVKSSPTKHIHTAGGKQNPHSSQSAIGALGPLQLGFTQFIPLHHEHLWCDVSLTSPKLLRKHTYRQASHTDVSVSIGVQLGP